MRPDMHHLLVERGHAGTGYTRHQPKGWAARCRFRNDEDDQRESFIEPRRWPQFSENLAPLRRYLEAQVGRPWDKVYAEIRAHVNADTAVQYHILQHLYDRLMINVWEDGEGRLWYRSWFGRTERLDAAWRRPVLYVCPRSGLIRRTRQRTRQAAPVGRPDHLPATGDDHEYRELGGQWYEVRWTTTTQDGKPIRFISYKRQLGYKELRKLGLRD
jgi:hypothetical protein